MKDSEIMYLYNAHWINVYFQNDTDLPQVVDRWNLQVDWKQ